MKRTLNCLLFLEEWLEKNDKQFRWLGKLFAQRGHCFVDEDTKRGTLLEKEKNLTISARQITEIRVIIKLFKTSRLNPNKIDPTRERWKK